jgi:arylsulfatase A-like enzyme
MALEEFDEIYWKTLHRGGSRPSAASIMNGWKLIHYLGTESTELYNLAADKGEKNDLAKAEPKKASQLLATLQQYVKEIDRTRK